jgi:DNA polymerase III subunit gamma/tau
MIMPRKNGDLSTKYRPYAINEVVGHETIKNMISNAIVKNSLPKAMLFTGPSGCGKTTFARIIALGLNCQHGPTPNPCGKCEYCKRIINLNSFAVMEVDAAHTSDVGTIRNIVDDLPSAALGNEKYKILIIDEAHNLSDKAEDALLKPLEDTPGHVYIILCTNYPEKLKEVTRNRCKTIQFGRLKDEEIYALLEEVAQFEGMSYTKDILKYIAEESEGTPRKSLSFLQQVGSEGSWTKDSASLIINANTEIDQLEVFEFCKILLKGSWKNVVRSYKNIKNVPVESIRIIIMGFMAGCLKNAKNPNEATKFSKIIDIISTPYYAPKPEHVLLNNLFKIVMILKDRNV